VIVLPTLVARPCLVVDKYPLIRTDIPPPLQYPGKAVQVEPIKPTLKPSGIKRLKLMCDEPISTSAFKFNLRRYTPCSPAPLPSAR
jgi:hypothetical protein